MRSIISPQEQFDIYWGTLIVTFELLTDISRHLTAESLDVSIKNTYFTIILPPFVQQKITEPQTSISQPLLMLDQSQSIQETLHRPIGNLSELFRSLLKIIENMGYKPTPNQTPHSEADIMRFMNDIFIIITKSRF